MARSLQYALILTSPLSHLRKSRAAWTKYLISAYLISNHLKPTRSNAEIQNRVVGPDPFVNMSSGEDAAWRYPHTLELFHEIRGIGKRRIIGIFFGRDVSRGWV